MEKIFIQKILQQQLNTAQKVWLGLELEELYKEEAKRRMVEGGRVGGKFKGTKKLSSKKGKARDLVAEKVGISGRTLDKGRRIVEEAKEDPEIQEAWEKSLEGKKSIEAVYKVVKKKTQPIEPIEREEVIEKTRGGILLDREISYCIDDLIEKAKESICIASPYIWGVSWLVEKLRQKKSDGVPIYIVTREINETIKQLAKFAEVRVDDKTFLHSKIVIIDKKEAYTGSGNITYTSLERNREQGHHYTKPHELNIWINYFENLFQEAAPF